MPKIGSALLNWNRVKRRIGTNWRAIGNLISITPIFLLQFHIIAEP